MVWNNPGCFDVLLALQKGKPCNNEGAHSLELLAGGIGPKAHRGSECGDSEGVILPVDSPQ